MNKKDLIVEIAGRTGLNQKQVNDVINSFCALTKETLQHGDSVCLTGFGTFKTKKRAARAGKNPFTGETIKIPSRTVPVFKPGKTLKNNVNSNS